MQKFIFSLVTVVSLFSFVVMLSQAPLPALSKEMFFFQHQFLQSVNPQSGNVKNLSLLLEKFVPKKMEDKIFQLALEEGAQVSILTTQAVRNAQQKLFDDMQKENIDVAVLPQKYTTFAFNLFDISKPLEIDLPLVTYVASSCPTRSQALALIMYHEFEDGDNSFDQQQKHIMLHSFKNGVYGIENDYQKFVAMQKWFDRLHARSDDRDHVVSK